jgi:hypothetical protein
MLDNAHISLEEKLRAVPVEGEFRCLISRMLDAQTFSLGLYLVSTSRFRIRYSIPGSGHRVRVDTPTVALRAYT